MQKREIIRLIHLQNGYNDTKQADGTAKDFHNEDLDEEAGVLGVCQCCAAAHDAHTDATEEVGKADSQTGSKHGVTYEGGHQLSQRFLLLCSLVVLSQDVGVTRFGISFLYMYGN